MAKGVAACLCFFRKTTENGKTATDPEIPFGFPICITRHRAAMIRFLQ